MISPLILFVTLSLVMNASYGLDSSYSSSRVQLLDLFLKPFGVSLQHISNLSPWTTLNCTRNLQKIQACNSTILDLYDNTTRSEATLVNNLLKSCSSGRFKCLQQEVKKSVVVKKWFRKVKVAFHDMCSKQCWKIYLDVEKDCIDSKRESKTEEFAFEVLDAYCREPKTSGESSYCTDNFIDGLFVQANDDEVCNVVKAIEDQRCTSSCYQEILDFYHALGSCVSDVTGTMRKYSVSPSPNTFGVIVQNSTVMCGKNQPRRFNQPTRSSLTTPTTTNSSNETSSAETHPATSSSLSGKLIAAIVVAVIVFGVAGAVLCRYFYQRCVNKPKLRFEDYGYSHLQMMQDQEDFYFNYDDDDDHGLLDL